jgi:hypothetical protein
MTEEWALYPSHEERGAPLTTKLGGGGGYSLVVYLLSLGSPRPWIVLLVRTLRTNDGGGNLKIKDKRSF